MERLQAELEQRDASMRALEQELQRLAELEQLAATRADKILELEDELSGRTDIINTQQIDLFVCAGLKTLHRSWRRVCEGAGGPPYPGDRG